MTKLAKFIVEKRAVFFLVFIVAVLYCGVSVGKVKINNDITSYLPPETETRQGITIMEEEFTTFAGASVMVTNITLEQAQKLADSLAEIPGVYSVGFDETEDHYTQSAALFSLTFTGGAEDADVLSAMEQVRTQTADYDVYISSEVGSDYSDQLAQEMLSVMLVAVVVIIAVLLFTSKSYFEIVIYFIVFAVAAVLNMGTNFLLGEVSSITNSIAVILQLALAIDYAIIFSHRYQDEIDTGKPYRTALIDALSKAIVEISSSSLTTIAGLVALTLMQFRMGYDLGIVLAKSILCSLITVFLLMPGLIMLFHKPMERTRHKSLVPSVRIWGRFLAGSKFVFLILFLLLMPVAVICSGRCQYAFADSSIQRIKLSEQDMINEKIADYFQQDTVVAVLVPRGDYESEKTLLAACSELPGVTSALGLANVEIEPGRVLTDSYTPRQFTELADLDYEEAQLLYGLYGYEQQQYQPIFGEAENYTVPLVDMFLFLFRQIDHGVVTLDDAQMETLGPLRDTLNNALVQLRGEQWSRLVFTADVEVESEEAVALTDAMRELARARYGDGVLVIGNITSAHELSESFSGDNQKITFLTIAFVFVILLFTFRSVATPVLLILVIQGSIFINFSFPYITGKNMFFMAYLIVSAIQMGATIDYAIVLTNRYLTLRESCDKRASIVGAVNDSFATIFTSGSIMTIAGFLIGYLTSDVYIGSIGLALGRGTLISIILVMTVLPQLLLLGDGLMRKTSFTIKFSDGGDEE